MCMSFCLATQSFAQFDFINSIARDDGQHHGGGRALTIRLAAMAARRLLVSGHCQPDRADEAKGCPVVIDH